MTEKKLEDMTTLELYYEAHCGLVCPFPVLEALRTMHLATEEMKKRYIDLCQKEQEYYLRKMEAKILYEERMK